MSYEQSHWGKESSLNNKKEVDSKSYKNIEKGSKEYIHFFDEISLYSYKDLSKLLDKNRDFYDFFESLIYYDENLSFDNPKGNNIQCKKFSCPIGVDAIFVDTGGQLHMCNKSDYSYPIGNVIDGFSKEKLANLYERYYKEVRANCLECWAFNYCKICPATIMISNNMNIKNRDICILSQNALSNMLIALIILSSYENLYENIIKFFRLQKKEESFLTFKGPVYKYDY